MKQNTASWFNFLIDFGKGFLVNFSDCFMMLTERMEGDKIEDVFIGEI